MAVGLNWKWRKEIRIGSRPCQLFIGLFKSTSLIFNPVFHFAVHAPFIILRSTCWVACTNFTDSYYLRAYSTSCDIRMSNMNSICTQEGLDWSKFDLNNLKLIAISLTRINCPDTSKKNLITF